MKRDTILDVQIAIATMERALEFIDQCLSQRKGGYVCFSNVHTTVMAHDDSQFAEILNNSLVSFPDGMPLALHHRFIKGHRSAQRISGPDFMVEFLSFSEKQAQLSERQDSLSERQDQRGKIIRHYFLGDTNEVLQDIISKCKKDFPSVYIAGYYSPPFKPLTEEELTDINNKIQATNPDIIWVGLGAPKQETWMYNNAKFFPNSILMGVGAAFRYFTGKTKRAPKIFRQLSLEWLFRLLQNPIRLFTRYAYTNSKFLWLVIMSLFFNREKNSRH